MMKNSDPTLPSKLFGLVLSGGRSTRMGLDKGSIVYHDSPQREYLYHLLENICDLTFLSIRKEQESEISNKFKTIIDRDEYRGPFNGLLSAHYQYPNVAWLVLACDLPLINLQTLKQLIKARDTNKFATAFTTELNGLPEPLAAIWEPKALERSKTYLLNAKSSCPRKFLINSDTALVVPEDTATLLNANSEEDYREVLNKLERN